MEQHIPFCWHMYYKKYKKAKTHAMFLKALHTITGNKRIFTYQLPASFPLFFIFCRWRHNLLPDALWGSWKVVSNSLYVDLMQCGIHGHIRNSISHLLTHCLWIMLPHSHHIHRLYSYQPILMVAPNNRYEVLGHKPEHCYLKYTLARTARELARRQS